MIDNDIQVEDIQARQNDYEIRKIVIAMGIEDHQEDTQKLGQQPGALRKYPFLKPLFEYLRERIEKNAKKTKNKNEFEIENKTGSVEGFETVRGTARYRNDAQRVEYQLISIVSKKDFHKALEMEGIHVIYQGHARYGRGACFDTYTNAIWGLKEDDPATQGDRWEDGLSDDSGLFRMAYPYVPVEIHDLQAHKYHFKPVPVEEEEPPNEKSPPFSRHPDARRPLKKIVLPKDLHDYVDIFTSASNTYYGVRIQGKDNLLLRAGWENTPKFPYDLGATQLQCKVFCHFGCSSQKHFWDIVRKMEYKGWERPDPPIDKFAYFTTNPSDRSAVRYWLYHLLTYDKENKGQSWWDSLQYAKKKTNDELSRDGHKFRIY